MATKARSIPRARSTFPPTTAACLLAEDTPPPISGATSSSRTCRRMRSRCGRCTRTRSMRPTRRLTCASSPPEKESGKTRLLESLEPRRGAGAHGEHDDGGGARSGGRPGAGADDAAGRVRQHLQAGPRIRRDIDGHSQRRLPAWREDAAFAFRRSGSPRFLPVFAPKAFAVIGTLPDTVASRSIRIELKRRTPGEHVERFRRRQVEAEAAPLRDALADLVRATRRCCSQMPARNSPTKLGDRAAGRMGTAPRNRRSRRRTIGPSALARQLSSCRRPRMKRTSGPGYRLACRHAPRVPRKLGDRLDDGGAAPCPLRAMKKPRGETGTASRCPARTLAKFFQAVRGEARGTIRLEDGTTPKGYLREQFDDAFSRYLGVVSATTATTASLSQKPAVSHPPQEPHVADVEDTRTQVAMRMSRMWRIAVGEKARTTRSRTNSPTIGDWSARTWGTRTSKRGCSGQARGGTHHRGRMAPGGPRSSLRRPKAADIVSGPPATELLTRPGALLTRTHLRDLGLERRAVDAVFRALPCVVIPGYARPMVRAEDYLELVERSTYRNDRVRP